MRNESFTFHFKGVDRKIVASAEDGGVRVGCTLAENHWISLVSFGFVTAGGGVDKTAAAENGERAELPAVEERGGDSKHPEEEL